MYNIQQLSPVKFKSPLLSHSGGTSFRYVKDERIPEDVSVISGEIDLQRTFECAGPREKVFFDSKSTRVAVVTCGGLCPGLNDVIREIVMELYYWYDVKDILGIRYGYSGFEEDTENPPIQLDPRAVSQIHELGGTYLGSSRGGPDENEVVDALVRLDVNILFCIGGDGTLRGANDINRVVEERGLKISVIGIPKTIDNDIPYVYRSFGFQSAVAQAHKVLTCAHTEAKGAPNGIGLVKLMGRDAGFVAAYATKASGNVNYCLVPEVAFPLKGKAGLLSLLRRRLKERRHAVIAVAEGAGKHLIGVSEKRDASGNVLPNDIGLFLKQEIKQAFAKWEEKVSVKYFDPSYIIRSVPADSEDSIFCADLGRCAVHAGMAGKTGMLVGYWHGEFVHIPLDTIHGRKKQLHLDSKLWSSVVSSTGQPISWC